MCNFHCKMTQVHLNRDFVGEKFCQHWDLNPRPPDLISFGLFHISQIAHLAPNWWQLASGRPLAISGRRQPHPDLAEFDSECVRPVRVTAHCLTNKLSLQSPGFWNQISLNYNPMRLHQLASGKLLVRLKAFYIL